MSGSPGGDARFHQLQRLVAQIPGLGAALGTLLDRRERSGRLPRSVTLNVEPEATEALRRLFSARAVQSASSGRVRIDLGAFLRASGCSELELEEELCRALDRRPNASETDGRRLRSELERGLADLARDARREAAQRFVSHELRRLASKDSELVQKAAESGATAALGLIRHVVSAIDAIGNLREPIRIQNFAARVLGSSKALRPGGDLFRLLSAALVDHDPRTRRALDEHGIPPHRTTELARALELNGVFQDEAAASVLCFGPLVYEKRGQRFDQVARHSALGESSRLIVQQLRDARFEPPPARRVTSFENLTPYLDYVDACVDRRITDEIVICSSGQASWAVVAVLSELARFALPVRHAGDLDRAGVQIMRSLRRRSGARIAPLMMDAAVHQRFQSRGQRLDPAERARLDRLIAADEPDNPCHGLLRAIAESGVWIEQEQFADELLRECFA